MHYVAISDQLSGKPFKMFEGETLDAAFLAAAMSEGGHTAIADGVVQEREAVYHTVHLRDKDPRSFWFAVMADLFNANNNRDFFYGEDRAEVEGQAIRFYGVVDA